MNIDLLFTVSQLWNLCSLLRRSQHGDLSLRQDKNFDNLVDELQLLNFHGLEHCVYIDTCRCTTSGTLTTLFKNCTCGV